MPQIYARLKDIDSPDLLVMFTNTVSHKMIHCTLGEAKGQNTKIARSDSGPMSLLKAILYEQTI